MKHGSLSGNCFEPITFECNEFQNLSQLIAKFTRENLAERDAEMANLPWTQTEKDKALARCRAGQRAWRAKKPVLCLNAVTDESCHFSEDEDEPGRRLCEYWGSVFPRPRQGALDITNTKMYCDMFRKFLVISAGPLVVLRICSWP